MSNTSPSSIIKKRSFIPHVDFSLRKQGVQRLLQVVSSYQLNESDVEKLMDVFERPNDFVVEWSEITGGNVAHLHVIGTLEKRFAVYSQDGFDGVLIGFGDYDISQLPECFLNKISVSSHKRSQIWTYSCSENLHDWLGAPSVYLVALYHTEIFLLPRFSLSLSDLIRAVRQKAVSKVFARDMQLGITINEIVDEIKLLNPDIVGISATFGQQDLLEELMSRLPSGFFQDKILAFGGSLSALNRQVLLNNFPESVICTGPGEPTIAGLVDVFRKNCEIDQVKGLAFTDDSGAIRYTNRVSPKQVDDLLPELDLLYPTFASQGIIQLETSRGCSYACSFCPRAHKGLWTGDDPYSLEIVLPDIDRIIRRFPTTSRRIFFVDEEFFGYRPKGESEKRVEHVSEIARKWTFSFETSSRADQVFRPNKSREWHRNRIGLWRLLKQNGLSRCLFGIESGVDSILTRFNKKTSERQNIVAIRILSLLGVPPRYTYITFDPLMTKDELKQTYEFQQRTDLILRQDETLSDAEILEVALNDEKSAMYDQGVPFHEQITYMLVSMECLADAPYTQMVKQEGLLGEFNSNMGRFDAGYLDPEIGAISDASQRWIDRNFSLDYLLKSIEKYSDGLVKVHLRTMRGVIKKSAASLLSKMITLTSETSSTTHFGNRSSQEQKEILEHTLNEQFYILMQEIYDKYEEIDPYFPAEDSQRIKKQIDIWATRQKWNLING